MRPAFGASVGSAFCLVFSCFAYAGLGRYGHLVPIKVVPNWRDDPPERAQGGQKLTAPTRGLRDAYTKPTRRTGYKCCLFVCFSVCLFVCWPSFPSFPSNSMIFHAFQFHSFHFPPPTQPTQIESQPTSFNAYASLRTPPKCLRQHFTRHSLSKLKLPTKKRCSSEHITSHPDIYVWPRDSNFDWIIATLPWCFSPRCKPGSMMTSISELTCVSRCSTFQPYDRSYSNSCFTRRLNLNSAIGWN